MEQSILEKGNQIQTSIKALKGEKELIELKIKTMSDTGTPISIYFTGQNISSHSLLPKYLIITADVILSTYLDNLKKEIEILETEFIKL